MTIYLDKDYKCYATNDGTMSAVETDIFNGKCDEYIEGYRFVPQGMTWVRDDGEAFRGEMLAPWKDPVLLNAYQEQYETLITEAAAAYESGVNSI